MPSMLLPEPATLYRKLNDAEYVKYDPVERRYTVVGADDVPGDTLIPAGLGVSSAYRSPSSVRLSMRAATSLPPAQWRKLVLLAMIEFQRKAHAKGDPEAARPYLEYFRRLLDGTADPESLRKVLRMSWQAVPYTDGRQHAYPFKAVGDGPDQGRTLYGQQAKNAIDRQQQRGQRVRDQYQQHAAAGGSATPPEIPEHGLSHRDHQQMVKSAVEKARAIRTGTTTYSAEDLKGLADVLPALPVKDLRQTRAVLMASFKGATKRNGMITALMDHVRAALDEEDKAAGLPPAVEMPGGDDEGADEPGVETETPAPAAEQPAAPPPEPAQQRPTPTPADASAEYDRLAEVAKRATGKNSAAADSPTPSAPAGPPDKSTLGDRLKAAHADPAQFDSLAADLAHGTVSRDDVMNAVEQAVGKDGREAVKRMPKAKMVEWLKENHVGKGETTGVPSPPQDQPAAPSGDAHPHAAAIEAYAQSLLASEIDHTKQYAPHKLAMLTDEMKENYLAKMREKGREVADKITDKDGLLAMHERGTFHPSNKRSRRLFEQVTGKKLPGTVAGTDAVIRGTIGHDHVAEHEAGKKAAEDAAAAEVAAEKAAKKAADDDRFDGFGADASHALRGKMRAHLDQQVRANGEVTTRRDMVKKRVEDGWTVEDHPADGRRFVHPNGETYFAEKQLSKTSLDYANHLIGRKGSKPTTGVATPESATPTQEATPPTPETSPAAPSPEPAVSEAKSAPAPTSPQIDLAEQDFHTYHDGKNKFIPVKGRPVKFAPHPLTGENYSANHDFFVHPTDGMPGKWTVSEKRSGLAVASPGGTPEDAAENARNNLHRHGLTGLSKAIEKSVKKRGESPSAKNKLDDDQTKDTIAGEGGTTPAPAPSPTPAVTPDGSDTEKRRLEGEGEGVRQDGVSTGQRLGDETPAVPGSVEPGAGEGTRQRPDAVPAGADGAGDGDVRAADRPGDAARDGAGTGDGGPARKRVATAPRAPRPRKPRTSPGGPPRDPESGVRLGGGIDGTAPALPDPAPAETSAAEPPAADNPTDVSAGNFRYDPTAPDFLPSGQKAKFRANLAAVRLLKDMQDEGRTAATAEEQAILSKFTGWGQFPGVFNDFWDSDWRKKLEETGTSREEWEQERGNWAEERDALKSLLTPDEWDAAKRSTLNAHYTHPDVVKAHWQLAEKLGFKGGRYLETSAGIGYYLGMMPPHIAGKTRSTAVELDPTTGGMLKHLYPAANVHVQGFQEHLAPDGYYDLVASNVPFGAYKVHDPKYNRHQANIHDYFFLKSADKVRPGGLVMHITSTGTMDKGDPKIRQELAKTCDLVGAIRFPSGAHKGNAGTDVVTDMLILRKRLPDEQPGDQSWLETTTVPDPAGGEPIPVNAYFAKNPHMVLGTIDRTGSMYRGNAANVSRTDDYEQRLRKAMDSLPSAVMSSGRAPAKRFEPEVLPAPGQVKDGGFHHENGKIFVRDGDAMTEQKLAAPAAEKIKAHLTVRDAMRAVMNAEVAGKDATAERAELNRAYDAFVKKHGFLNAPGNKRAFLTDPDSPPLLALEKYDPKTKKAAKADIFTKPTISAVKPVEKVGTVAEGLGVSLHETGGLDIDHVAKLTGLHRDEVGKQLVEQGLAYEDPTHGYQPADQYLSGNVRRKLAAARAAAANDPKFAANVAALEKVQPEDIHHDDIDVKLGAPWVPPSDVSAFAAHLMQTSPSSLPVRYNGASSEWHAEFSGYSAKRLLNSQVANQVWGTDRANFIELLSAALNGRQVTITDPVPGGEKGERVVNKEATAAAAAKQQEIKDEFKNWIWSDDERRERLHRHYNDNFNNVRNIRYDGSHQSFPGKNPAIDLREHQKDFVWQVVTTGKGLAGHEVGTGKTYTMIAAAMELRRLGLAKKPAILCKKANVEAITADALKLYPGARILSTADMFDAKNRKRAVSRIATGDYDVVIMTHDHFDMLKVRPETERKYMREELEQLEQAYADAWEASGQDRNDKVVKQLDKAKQNLIAKLQGAISTEKKDDAVHFEDLGVDQLFVDEAHRYKTLPTYTKMQNLKGVSAARSNRATGMLMKARWLMANNGGRGLVFATGTPVTNTMGELYNVQRFLQDDELRERGLNTFDAWAKTFGDTETKMERTASGEYKAVTRFSRFVNLPELTQLSRQILDVQRADDLKNRNHFDTRQEAESFAAGKTGAAIEPGESGGFVVTTPSVVRPPRKDKVTTAPKTPHVDRMMGELMDRARALKGPAQKGGDNMLSICSDGRKGSVDMRMLYADAPDDPNSKTNRLVRSVLDIHKANPGHTQMIFSDVGVNFVATDKVAGAVGAGGAADNAIDVPDDAEGGGGPTADLSSRTGFHLYGDIIDKLVKGGIPREKIADFSQLEGKKKEEAIDGLKSGDVLVAIGSTEKLGTGVNAQDKLLALHHLDCPWRPSDLEQRDGRGWRHGNKSKEIQIHRYVTEGSLDELFWQGIARKASFIRQVMKPNAGNMPRSAQEVDTDELSPEAIMAAASGDMRILEKVQVDEDVKNLKNAATRHERDQKAFEATMRNAEAVAAGHRRKIDDLKATVGHLDANPDFHLKIGGQTYTERPEAEAAFEEAAKAAPGYRHKFGEYRGLPIFATPGGMHFETLGGHTVGVNPSLKSIEAKARQLRVAQEMAEGDLARHHQDTEQVRSKIGKAFPKADELAKKIERQKQLEKELSGAKDEGDDAKGGGDEKKE